jgi:hypothetical protein
MDKGEILINSISTKDKTLDQSLPWDIEIM